MKRHPGITMHQLSFGGGLMGLLFAAGSVLIFVLGFPALWYFVLSAFVFGVAIALFLRTASNRMSQRNKPLSIFAASEDSGPAARPKPIGWHRMPRLATT